MDSIKTFEREANLFVHEGKKMRIVGIESVADKGSSGKYITINGSKKIDFTRLDYLSLGSSDEIRSIMYESIQSYDLSCPASQMLVKMDATVRLEQALESMHGMDDVILFSNGYSANDNVMQALGNRLNTHYIKKYMQAYAENNGMKSEDLLTPTVFFVDSESHYSLNHGSRVARSFSQGLCFVESFSCMNYAELEVKIEASKKNIGENAVRIIVSDALSSTSGRLFDVELLSAIAERHGCLLYIDEAHSVGVFGPKGSGVAAGSKSYEQRKNRMIVMGTLTKSFSQLGGYVAVPNKNIGTYIRSCSPQYIFSAPILTWMSDTLTKTIQLVQGEFGEKRRKNLHDVSQYMRNSLLENDFDILGSNSQIIPVLIHDESKADQIKQSMDESGFLISLFKYPAVPHGSALIRFSICADITKQDVDAAVGSLLMLRNKLRF